PTPSTLSLHDALPIYFALGTDPMWLELAEDARTGDTVREVSAAARELEMIVVAPIYELDPGGRRFNTAVVIDEAGRWLGKFRKRSEEHTSELQSRGHL